MKIAGVQFDISFASRSENLTAMESSLRNAAAQEASLVVFPECTTTGYCFDSAKEAFEVAEPIDGPSTQQVESWCRQWQLHVVFGLLEIDQSKLFNSLVVVGPTGVLASYRKTHLPFLGVDRFVTPGDRLPDLVDINGVNIGLGICYDSSFPEFTRSLALQGADIVILPTNWPPTSMLASEVIPPARAMENHIYFMAINRIGVENGVTFIGRSRICDPLGRTMAHGSPDQPDLLLATIDPQLARKKHLVTEPGRHEVHRWNDRRPELYQDLTRSHP